MFSINTLATSYDYINYSNIGHPLMLGSSNMVLSGNEPSSRWSAGYEVYFLKNDSEYIPISCFGNLKRTNNFRTKHDFVNNLIYQVQRNISTSYSYNGYQLNPTEMKMVSDKLGEIYSGIVKDENIEYSRNILISARNTYANSHLRKKDLPDILTGANYSGVIPFGNPIKRSLVSLFYYTDEGKLLLTLVIKKNKLLEFRRDINDDKINPENVEIWIDKNLVENKDRKTFHKWIREEFIMKYTMMGFNIKLKDDILTEFVEIPNLKFKDFHQFSSFKKGLNQFLLAS